MNAAVLERLLAVRPFKSLYLCIGNFEITIDRPQDVRVLADKETLVRFADNVTDFYDLRLIERLHVEGFDPDDLNKMLKN